MGESFEVYGQVDIILRNAARVVRRKIDRDSIVNVRPFRMVIVFLDLKSGRRHEANGVGEVRERIFAVKLSVKICPLFKFA